MKLKLIERILILFFVMVLFIQCGGVKKTAIYDFETGTQDWIVQNWREFRGGYGVEQTSEYSNNGNYALLLDCNVNTKGEVYVDLRKNFKAPLDLTGKTIKCWVLIPTDTTENAEPLVTNDPEPVVSYENTPEPYGVQLFARSVQNEGKENEQWFSEYSEWYAFSGLTGSWMKLTLGPGIESAKEGSKDQGFDSKNIVVIGVRVAAQSGAPSSFKGKLFIDNISW